MSPQPNPDPTPSAPVAGPDGESARPRAESAGFLVRLREFWWDEVLPRLGKAFIWILRGTLRLSVEGREHVRAFWENEKPVIITFWHGHLLMMPFCAIGRPVAVLVSGHRDGRLIGSIMTRMGFSAAHGSATEGGLEGFRALSRCLRANVNVAITPDGPRGPRHQVNPGVVLLAKHTGAPILPIAFAASKKKS